MARASGLITVVTHIDADGVTSGGIAARMLAGLNKRFVMLYGDSLTPRLVDAALSTNPSVVWFTDLGSSGWPLIERILKFRSHLYLAVKKGAIMENLKRISISCV